MSDDLPMGWIEKSLSELTGTDGLMTDGDWIESKDQDPNGEVRLIQLADIGDGIFVNKSNRFLTLDRSKELRCTFLQEGDLLIARMPDPLGRACLFPNINQLSVTAVDVCVWRAGKEGINSKWLMYFINSPTVRNQIQSLASGTTRQRISGGNLKKLPLPVPPLNEQRRIVDKLDRIGDRHRTARNELSHIPKLIARYKQAILAAACSGKLTEDWRDKNPNVESASILLKQIQEKRNKEHEKASTLAISKSRRKPKLIDNSEFADFEFDSSENFDLPESWVFCNCKMLADLITDGEHATPIRTEDGILLLSARNVQNGFLSLEKVDYIPDYEYERITKRCNPETNDILISCSGSVGRVCRVPDNVKFTLVRSVALIKLQYNLELSEYLELALQSTISQSQILKLQKSTAQANLFLGQIGKIVILLPPLEEQKEIVRRIEDKFAKIDKMEQEYQKAAKLCDRLEQATLAKAFRGELVPQDPNDEPASVLLEQVKSERSKGKIKK
jgi:type I restriction enzyme S subunit